jgi:hypothetical protein
VNNDRQFSSGIRCNVTRTMQPQRAHHILSACAHMPHGGAHA